ncbi:formylglycine-generating enzyme family protein [Streptomyces tanashiensis]|uniref:formylglycine-generating enzyme family protein n=1 Tax=Streptomyces tanashiensis TaxID=67367 RepID=UPI0036E3D6B2
MSDPAHEGRSSCCNPGRVGSADTTGTAKRGTPVSLGTVPVPRVLPTPVPRAAAAASGEAADLGRRVDLPAATFLMGNEDAHAVPGDGEGPVREARVGAFSIDAYAVTNARFSAFVAATGYVTDAERFGWSYVCARFLPAEQRRLARRVPQTPWWCAVPGASWRQPEGPGSGLDGREDHPVTHMSWADADTFCRWDGGRLPTETEWEYAARGGLVGRRYPWGDELEPDGEIRCNIWQGPFPFRNTRTDGYLSTVPVHMYEPNGFGLHNVVGNVWEWCADRFIPDRHPSVSAQGPKGPPSGRNRVMRGGSHMCHRSYCNRYRVAARSSNTPDSSAGNLGFRCVFDRP